MSITSDSTMFGRSIVRNRVVVIEIDVLLTSIETNKQTNNFFPYDPILIQGEGEKKERKQT